MESKRSWYEYMSTYFTIYCTFYNSLLCPFIVCYIILLTGSDDRETLATMNNLAVLYNNSQNIDCARSLYEDIIRVRKSINPHGKETIDAMIALGRTSC